MMTLMVFSFCSWTRTQFSVERPPRLKALCLCTAAARRPRPLPVHVVERVDEAEVRELHVAARPLPIGVLDVQVGDVVGQNRHLVSVYFVEVLVLQPVVGQVVDEAGDEGPRARRRVEYLDVVVGETPAKVLLQQVVRARTMKSTTSLGV